MRVIGGRLKGRVLKGPAAATRPTSDRLREQVFNIIAHGYGGVEGVRALDLFAGTGALAIEALSRGASFALLVDQSAAAAAVIRANIETLGLADETKIVRRDARRLGSSDYGRFSLVFLDPPYDKGFAAAALTSLREGGWLETNALVIVEEAAKAEVAPPDGFALLETRRSGDTQIVFLRAQKI